MSGSGRDEYQEDLSDSIQDQIDASASPGFTWGDSGNIVSGSWLLNDTVPSNKAGRRIFLDSATLEAVFATNENISTFDLAVYEHDGTTYTLITTVSIVAARGAEFNIASLPLTTGKELAIQVSSGSCKNVTVGCVLKGTFA